jgi:hypothetical protein
MSGSTSASVGALARADGKKLLAHPAFLTGMVMAVGGSLAFVLEMGSGPATWDEDGWTAYIGVVMLGIFTLVATNLTASRDRRAQATEQHAALPALPATRTWGFLTAALWPAAAAAVLVTGVTAIGLARGTTPQAVELAGLAGAVGAVLLLGVIGVTLAVWIPRTFVAVFVAFALFFVSPGEPPRAWHALAPFETFDSTWLAWWHVAYLAGLGGLFAALAVGREDRRPTVVVLGVVSLVTVVTSAVVMLDAACEGGVCLL